MPTTIKNGIPYPEPPRSDELGSGVPDPSQAAARQERRAGGAGIPPGAKLVPSKGGRAHLGRTKMTHDVRDALPVSDNLKRNARHMRKRTCAELARDVGGGTCGLIASAMVKLASEDMAMRESALESGDVEVAQRLGVSARGHLLAARDVAAKDAESRPHGHRDGAHGAPPPGYVVVRDGAKP
jgi:hypothetical protein